ncbi:MAG: N-acetylmuramoyl-L-alanine amidase [Eggerthia catenaformis]|uniref:peptidoglycan recognition protein family protein n=1 Tax=Eggerthia catenaformis TaxID=31973 RepID=UPI003F9FF737
MSLKWNTDYIAHNGGYGADRKYSDLKYIIIHYTGNKKDTALANAKYFHNNKVMAGANCFIDGEGVVYKSTPISGRTYSVGVLHNKTYAKYWGVATDRNSINIEIACDKGNYESTDKAIEYAIELTRFYMKKYNIPASHVLRHKDVCGKNCPAYFWDDGKWEKEFKSRLTEETKHPSGWKHNSKGWWYEYADGSYPKSKWLKLGTKWYYFKSDGYACQNEWFEYKGRWYYFDDNCYMINGGWRQIKGKYYYLGSDGAAWTDEIIEHKGKHYYVGSDGAMVTNADVKAKVTLKANKDGELEF